MLETHLVGGIVNMEFPLWASLAAVGGGVALMLCLVTCCTVRCFRPENSRGPKWVQDKDGKEQVVNALSSDGADWLLRRGPAAAVSS